MLLVVENLLKPEEVAALRQALAEASWTDGRASAGALAANVKRNRQADEANPAVRQACDMILSRVGAHPLVISAALPRRIYPPRFNRYGPGEQYGLHVDAPLMRDPHEGALLRTDLSATLFLTEPEAYEGGVLRIETAFGAQEVKLEAGDMVLYPASSLHEVTPVTSGERVCAFFWIESLVADETRRTLAFDLDQSIQALRAAGTDPAEIVRLSGVYSNLLRMWVRT